MTRLIRLLLVTAVLLALLAVGVRSGTLEIDGLKVSNPPGYQASHFLRLDEGALAVGLGSLTKETIEVPSVTLSGVDLILEKKGAAANSD